MSQLIKDKCLNKWCKPKIHQGGGQSRNFCNRHNYDQLGYQNRYRSNSGDRRIQFSGRIQYGQKEVGLGYEQNYRNDYRRGYFRGNMRMYQHFGRQNSRGGYRGNYRNENYNRERGRSKSRERSFSQSNNRRNDRSTSNSRSRSESRLSTNRDRIGCYKCQEYDHFAEECPTTKEKRETEQIQQ